MIFEYAMFSSVVFPEILPAERAGVQFQSIGSASTGTRTRMADVEQRFFCHQCSLEIPRCLLGTISEL